MAYKDTLSIAGTTSEFPRHFVNNVLPRIGGYVLPDGSTVFPKKTVNGFEFSTLKPQLTTLLNQEFPRSDFTRENGGVEIGHPSSSDAREAQKLHSKIWETQETYPWIIYHPESPAATRLVATIDGEVVGFLLGFWGCKEGKSWLESQILAVNPEYRKSGIAKILKLRQMSEARESKVSSIHWTADPLQYSNALLNYNSLGAVATEFHAAYYQFSNSLNLTPASRFTIEWPTSPISLSAIKHAFSSFSLKPSLSTAPHWEKPANLSEQEDILIEIPPNWTETQKDFETANYVREHTDHLFAQVIGKEPNQYTIGRIIKDGDRVLLHAKPNKQLANLLG